MSRLRLGAPPSFRNPLTPPWRDTRLQLSHVTWDDPYPSPNPIQNPSRGCGYCAAAAHAPPTATTPTTAIKPAPDLKQPPRRRKMGRTSGTRREESADGPGGTK